MPDALGALIAQPGTVRTGSGAEIKKRLDKCAKVSYNDIGGEMLHYFERIRDAAGADPAQKVR